MRLVEYLGILARQADCPWPQFEDKLRVNYYTLAPESPNDLLHIYGVTSGWDGPGARATVVNVNILLNPEIFRVWPDSIYVRADGTIIDLGSSSNIYILCQGERRIYLHSSSNLSVDMV